MLSTSEIQRREVEAKLADAEAKLEESKLAIASLQASKATLQNTLNELANNTSTKRKIACFGHSNGRRRMLTL